jgi:hypothetical protein
LYAYNNAFRSVPPIAEFARPGVRMTEERIARHDVLL